MWFLSASNSVVVAFSRYVGVSIPPFCMGIPLSEYKKYRGDLSIAFVQW